MKTAAHPLPHEPEWAAAIQKEVSPMNTSFVTIVTDEPPRASLSGTDDDIPVVRFGHGFDVQLPNAMSPEDKAAWCRAFAGQLAHLATRIEHQAATVTP